MSSWKIALLCLILGRVLFATVVVPYNIPTQEGTKTALVLLPSDHFRLTNPYVDSFELNYLQEHSITNIHHADFILERVIPAAEAWYLAHQSTKGALSNAPNSPMRDILQTLQGMREGRFGMVILMDEDDLSKIRAIVRFVTTKSPAELQLWQKRLFNRGVQPYTNKLHVQLEQSMEPLFRRGSSKGNTIPIEYVPSTWWGGSEQEVKSWGAMPSSQVPYSALCFILAEIHKVTRRSGARVNLQDFPDWEAVIAKHYGSSPGTRQRIYTARERSLPAPVAWRFPQDLVSSVIHFPTVTPSPANWWERNENALPDIILSRRPELGVRISSYVMEFDVSNADLKTKAYTLLDYYQDMGWTITHQVPNPDLENSTSFVARISRENWVKSLSQFFGRRIERSPFRSLESLSLQYRPNFAFEMGWLSNPPECSRKLIAH
jgi:hypothetical protein